LKPLIASVIDEALIASVMNEALIASVMDFKIDTMLAL